MEAERTKQSGENERKEGIADDTDGLKESTLTELAQPCKWR